LQERPETLSVFLENGMHCVGCVMAPFMTVAEAAASHRLDPDELIEDLRAAASGPAAEAAR
jgi:hybrid cluster-associated redox disulfide protein